MFNTNQKHQSAFADRYMLSKDRARVREREREKTGEIAMEINIAEKFSSSCSSYRHRVDKKTRSQMINNTIIILFYM